MRAFKEAFSESIHNHENGLYIWLDEYDESNSLLFEHEQESIVVQIFCFAGRSGKEKDTFFRLCAEKLSAAGEDTNGLVMFISDIGMTDWCIAGENAEAFFSGS